MQQPQVDGVFMTYMLSLDPGESTGFALWCRSDLLRVGTVTHGLQGFDRWTMPYHEILVVEDFVCEPDFTGRPVASEVLGLAWGRSSALKKVRQARSMKASLFGKNHSEAERFAWLRERGFTGNSHELDAITHGLIFMKNNRNRDALRRYWNIG